MEKLINVLCRGATNIGLAVIMKPQLDLVILE